MSDRDLPLLGNIMEQHMQLSLDFQPVTAPSGQCLSTVPAIAIASAPRFSSDDVAPRSNVVQFRSDRAVTGSHSGSTAASDPSANLINRILSSVRFYE